jgi:UDP-GlcNAc:undecaprenyl-phosphate GlcNAc-1-phosphate transferase
MIFLLIIVLNFFFLLLYNPIKEKINLYDNPDSIRKIHKKKIPLLGGFLFLSNILTYLFYIIFFRKDLIIDIFGFKSLISNIVFILSFILFFFIGYLDDKIKISAKKRLFLFIFILIVNLLIIPEIHIALIKLSFMDPFSIGIYSYFWTLLCFLLFINAFNFFDGINLQSAGLIYSICLFFLYKNIFFDFFLIIFIANCFFVYLNYQSKSFLGNNGSFYIPFLFGSLFISAYNNASNIVAEEVVILMLIPGLDLLRLFFQRIFKGINPFKADKEHIHHYLINKFSDIKSAFIIQLLTWVPFSISQLFGYFYLAIIIQIFFYCLIILKYKN